VTIASGGVGKPRVIRRSHPAGSKVEVRVVARAAKEKVRGAVAKVEASVVRVEVARKEAAAQTMSSSATRRTVTTNAVACESG